MVKVAVYDRVFLTHKMYRSATSSPTAVAHVIYVQNRRRWNMNNGFAQLDAVNHIFLSLHNERLHNIYFFEGLTCR